MTIELGDYVALSKAWGSGEYRTRTPPNLQFTGASTAGFAACCRPVN